MTFKIKRTKGEGVQFEVTSGRSDGGYQWGLPARTGYQWGLPARTYRRLARDTINALLAENRRLRHGLIVVTSPQPSFRLWAGATLLDKLAPKEGDE